MKLLAMAGVALKSNKVLYIMVAIILTISINAGTVYKLNSEVESEARLFAAIIDEDKSQTSLLAVERFVENPTVNIIQFENYDLALKALFRGEVEVVLLVKEGFEKEINSGNIKRIIELNYSPENVTAELIAEALAREVVRIFVSINSINYIQRQYNVKGEVFTEELRKEAIEHTESFWADGLTMNMNVSYADNNSDTLEIRTVSFRTIVIDLLINLLIFLLMFQFSSELIMQKKIGVLKGLRIYNITYFKYAILWMTVKTFIIIIFFAVSSLIIGVVGERDILKYSSLIIFGGVGAIILGNLKNEKILFSLIPLLAIVVSLLVI
jgi:hypothetical protein